MGADHLQPDPDMDKMSDADVIQALEGRRKYWCMVAAIALARLGAVSPETSILIKATDLMECVGWPIMVAGGDGDNNGNDINIYVDAPDVRERMTKGTWGRDGNRSKTVTIGIDELQQAAKRAIDATGTKGVTLYGPDGITPIT